MVDCSDDDFSITSTIHEDKHSYYSNISAQYPLKYDKEVYIELTNGFETKQ